MTQIPARGSILQITLYGLPKDTDVESLTPLARDVAAHLEEMGVFDQREFEPAHLFYVSAGENQ